MKSSSFLFTLLFLVLLAVLPATTNAAKSSSAGQGISYYKSGFPEVAKPLLLNDISADPSTLTETCYYLGNIYYFDNQIDSAKYYFQKGLDSNPNNSINAIGLAMLKINTDSVAADKEFTELLKLKQNKKDVDMYIAVANSYLFSNKADKALVYYNKAVDLKPKYAPLFVLLGDIEAFRHNSGEACKNYEQAIYFDKKCREAYIKYARVYKLVNSSLAIEKLNTLKENDPSFLLAERELADTYFSIDKFDEAAKSYEIYLQTGNSSVLDLKKYAFILFMDGNNAKSMEIVNMGLQKEPLDPAFNRLKMYNDVDMANKLFQGDDKTQFAEATRINKEGLQVADVFFNKSLKPRFTGDDYYYYGKGLFNDNQLDAAVAQYEKAVSIDSTKNDIYKEISDVYSKKGAYDKALYAFEKYYNGTKENKKTLDMKFQLGKTYYSAGTDTTNKDTAVTKSFLMKADVIFGEFAEKNQGSYLGNFYRARTNLAIDTDLKLGLATPYYQKTIDYILKKYTTPEELSKYNRVLIECYRYFVYYYSDKDDFTQAMNYCNKILSVDQSNSFAKAALDNISKHTENKQKSKK